MGNAGRTRAQHDGAPAAGVELNEAPSARESDGIVPGSENHDNFSHFLDGANEHLLPPGRGSIECRVLRGGDQIQPHDGVPAARLEKKKTAKRLWRSILLGSKIDGFGVAAASYLQELQERVLPGMAHKPRGTADALVPDCMKLLAERLLRLCGRWKNELIFDVISCQPFECRSAAVFFDERNKHVDAAANHRK